MTDRNKVFKIERDQRTLIVIPQGKDAGFRYNDVHLESNAVVRLLDDPNLANVVIDLENLDYSGSILIGVLIRIARKACDSGGRAAICCASDSIQEILETMNLFKLWPSYPTRADALKAMED
jgi:anti-anti-sigma factor